MTWKSLPSLLKLEWSNGHQHSLVLLCIKYYIIIDHTAVLWNYIYYIKGEPLQSCRMIDVSGTRSWVKLSKQSLSLSLCDSDHSPRHSSLLWSISAQYKHKIMYNKYILISILLSSNSLLHNPIYQDFFKMNEKPEYWISYL